MEMPWQSFDLLVTHAREAMMALPASKGRVKLRLLEFSLHMLGRIPYESRHIYTRSHCWVTSVSKC